MLEREFRTSNSRESNVLIINADAWEALADSVMAKFSIMLSGSVVRIKLGKSLRRISGIPGSQSILVSKYPFVR